MNKGSFIRQNNEVKNNKKKKRLNVFEKHTQFFV